ncbi:MAG: DUF1501 domain-containing protein [Planctomycetia bacterium]|nr:DUF1501 domain-containing protein [Planctomycetia bacterium]
MLNIGSFPTRVCQGINRRTFLQAGLTAPFALGLPACNVAAEAAKAKSVLLVWLWGAPSHLDTFDPKPNAPAEFRGPFSTIATRTPGVRVTEVLPKLAARSHKYTLIRSHKNFHIDHLKAGTIALTGADEAGEGLAPNFGSVLARHRGPRQLPPFISIGRGNPRDVVGPMKGYGGGNWGKVYDPFLVNCSEQGEVDIPSLQLLDGLTPQHLEDRRQLLAELDGLRQRLDGAELDKWDATRRRAYQLLTSPDARKALDVSRESQQARDAYGQTSFGQSCLLARRLIEAQVPYVQVNWSQYVEAMTPNCDFGWDTHIYNFEMLADRHCPIFDRVVAALLDDLDQRGLLQTTLVIAMGEFGRTPKINGTASRDHWPNCYFSLWAGAGLQPGKVIGESDRTGSEPITEPITPAMIGTTMLELSGVTSQQRAEFRVLPSGRVIDELI